MSRTSSIPRWSSAIARTWVIPLAAGACLAACTPAENAVTPAAGDAAAPAPATTPVEATPAPVAPAGGTVGGDGSDIVLEVLREDDVSGARLQGELACSFSEDGRAPLLYAMGVVGAQTPSQGVVKVAGYVEPVRALGGFDGMTANPTFTGQGKTIRIETTGAAIGGGESPPRPATLTYLRADGASRAFEGRWQCGP